MTIADLAPGQRRSATDNQSGGAGTHRPVRVPAQVSSALWAVAACLVAAYGTTSLVIVTNATGNASGVVWLPTFPDWYYAVSQALYLPFGWWFALLSPLQAWRGVDFTTFAWVSRAPFISGAVAAVASWLAPNGKRTQVAVMAFVGTAVAICVGATGALALAHLGVRDAVESAAREAGPWGPILLFALMAAQVVPTPIPTVAITLAGGLLYGVAAGTAIAWSGAMVAATVSFLLGRWFGRPVVSRLGGSRALESVDRWTSRGAFRAVLVSRLVPAVSFRAASLASGLLPIGLPSFLLATGIGQLPATVAYAALGASVVSDAGSVSWAAGGVGVVAGLSWLARAWFSAGKDVRSAWLGRLSRVSSSVRFRLGASAAMIALLAWRLGAGQIGEAVKGSDYRWLGAGAVATVAALLVSAWKWQFLLRATRVIVPIGTVFEAYLVGQFFNNVLPSSIGGDVARAHVVARVSGNLATVAGTIVGERLIAGIALVATALAALAASPSLAGTVGDSVGVTAIVFACLTIVGGVPSLRTRVVRALGTQGWRAAVARSIEALSATLSDTSVVMPVLALSVVFQGLVIAVAWTGFRAVGAEVPIDATVALIPVISAIQLLPVSVGGFGVREGAYVVLFGACCATPAPMAVAASLAFAGIVGVVSLSGGILFAFRGREPAPTLFPEVRALADAIRTVERETWFDADWLWTFAEGMRAAGRTTEQTIAAIRRQRDANRLPLRSRVYRRAQLTWRAFDLRRLTQR